MFVVVSSLIYFMFGFTGQSINSALPAIAIDLEMTHSMTGLVHESDSTNAKAARAMKRAMFHLCVSVRKTDTTAGATLLPSAKKE